MKNFRFHPIYLPLIAYLLLIIFGFKFAQNQIFVDIIKPVFLATLAFYAYKASENYHGRFRNNKDNAKTMIIMAILYIIVFSLSGLVIGFSYSIYSHHILAILKNLYQIVLIVILTEYLRSYVINLNPKSKIAIVSTTVIFILLEINYSVLFAKFADTKDTFEYVSSIILPLIFSGVLYSKLALMGGYRLTIPYRFIITIFMILTPIVPAFDWFLTGMFGIIYPVVVFIVMKKYSKKPTSIRREHKKSTSVFYYIALFIMLMFILFVYGLFENKPIVVLSNSMVPVFSKGDVVVYRTPDEEEKNKLENGTIVVYNKDNQFVIHRIVRTIKRMGETMYITKGDANKSDDFAPVKKEEIVGIYSTSVKYIGYPSLWLNEIFNKKQAIVEIQ